MQITYRYVRLCPMVAKILMNQKHRTEDEIHTIQIATKHLKYFKELNQKPHQRLIHYNTCKFLKYQSYQCGDIIFKENEQPDNVFIILKGSALVYTNKKYLTLEIEQAQQALNRMEEPQKKQHYTQILNKIKLTSILQTINKSYTHSSLLVKLRQNKEYCELLAETGGLYPDQFKNIEYFLQFGVFTQNLLQTLKEGDVFGEIAVIMNQPRSATVVAMDNLELVYIEKDTYRNEIWKTQYTKMNKRVVFLQKSFFNDIPQHIALQYAYDFVKLKFRRGQIVYKQNSISDEIYIIKKGEVELYQKQSDNNVAKLARLASGQTFGQLEIEHKEQRQYSVMVLSDSLSVLTLHYKVLDRFMENFPQFKTNLRNQVKIRGELFKNSISTNSLTKVIKFRAKPNGKTKSLTEVKQTELSKQTESPTLLSKIAERISRLKASNSLPTKKETAKLQTELYQSLADIQEIHQSQNKLERKQLFLMPDDEQQKLRQHTRSSLILRQIVSDKDPTYVDRKEVVSMVIQQQHAHARTISKWDTLKTESDISYSLQKLRSESNFNKSQTPNRRIMVSSKHNLFRQMPQRYFIFKQQYQQNLN